MKGVALEQFLARLYVDERFRQRFFSDRAAVARAAGLAADEIEAMARIDRVELELCAQSFAGKRAQQAQQAQQAQRAQRAQRAHGPRRSFWPWRRTLSSPGS